MVKLDRIFKDTSDFGKNREIPLAWPFAKSLEWLYDESFFPDDDDGKNWRDSQYYMSKTISLCDLVNIVVCIISKAVGDFALSDINSLIANLEAVHVLFNIDEVSISWKHEGNFLIVGKAKSHVVEVFLWGAYIYWRYRSEREPEDVRAKRAMELLYNLFVQKTGLTESKIKKHILMKNLDHSMVIFAKSDIRRRATKADKKPSDGKCDGKTDARIEELAQKLKDLENELEAFKEKKKGINQHLTALLGLKLAPLLNINYTNKKQLAPVLSKLFGWGKRRLEQELCSYMSNEDELELANIFSELSPEIAKEICPKWNGQLSSETTESED